MFDYADFLLGYQAEIGLASPTVSALRDWGWYGYLQDDWKVNHKLSVNLGLRYEFDTPIYEANNQLANFDPATESIVLASSSNRYTVNPNTRTLDRALARPSPSTTTPCCAAASASAMRTGTASAPTTSA